MKKGFLSQMMDLMTGSMIVVVLGVLTTPLITRIVAPDAYGQYSMFNTCSSLIMSICVLGLDQAMFRYFFVRDDSKYQKGLFQFSLGISLLVSLACGALVFLVLSYLGYVENVKLLYIFCLGVSVIFEIIFRFASVLVRLSYKTKLYSLLSIIKRLVYVLAALFILQVTQIHELYSLIFAMLLSEGIVVCVACLSQKDFFKININAVRDVQLVTRYSEIIKYSLPLIVSTGVMHIFQATDKFCIDYFGTYSDVGVYASAQSLIGIFAIIQTSFNTLWAPKAIEHFEKDRNDKNYFVKMNAYITITMFTFGVAVLLFRNIIVLFLGEEYREATYILPFLLLNPIMYTISETTVQGISFYKQTGKQVFIIGITALLNLLLNVMLINKIGYKGAAVSTGISYIVFFTLRTCVAYRYYPVKFKLGRFYVLTIAFVSLCAYSMYHSFNMELCVLGIGFIFLEIVLYHRYMYEMIVYVSDRLSIIRHCRNRS